VAIEASHLRRSSRALSSSRCGMNAAIPASCAIPAQSRSGRYQSLGSVGVDAQHAEHGANLVSRHKPPRPVRLDLLKEAYRSETLLCRHHITPAIVTSCVSTTSKPWRFVSSSDDFFPLTPVNFGERSRETVARSAMISSQGGAMHRLAGLRQSGLQLRLPPAGSEKAGSENVIAFDSQAG
jgi:hypothetical protein